MACETRKLCMATFLQHAWPCLLHLRRSSPAGGGPPRLACPLPAPDNRVHRRPKGHTGGAVMPIATPEIYAQMLDRAKQQGFAYPAINVTSTQTLNAALRGFADAGSDGIVQISTGGAEYLSGQAVKDMVTGASALAEFAHVVADKYPVHVALHTDHCPKDKLD